MRRQTYVERAYRESKCIVQIDLDVNRTYRDHVNFRLRYGPLQCALFRLLAAFSAYDTTIGYCQGMSTIAALLLIYMPEEDAFWSLVALFDNPLYDMHGLYLEGFPKLHRCFAIHDRLLQATLPALYKHLVGNADAVPPPPPPPRSDDAVCADGRVREPDAVRRKVVPAGLPGPVAVRSTPRRRRHARAGMGADAQCTAGR